MILPVMFLTAQKSMERRRTTQTKRPMNEDETQVANKYRNRAENLKRERAVVFLSLLALKPFSPEEYVHEGYGRVLECPRGPSGPELCVEVHLDQVGDAGKVDK